MKDTDHGPAAARLAHLQGAMACALTATENAADTALLSAIIPEEPSTPARPWTCIASATWPG